MHIQDPIYVVTGHPRSGTNMMVRACMEGGLPAVFDADRERLNTTCGDEFYRPNPSGFWEIGVYKYMDIEYISALPHNHVVNIKYQGLPILPKSDYRIVFMERDPVEIESSFRAFDELSPIPKDFSNWYRRTMDHVQGILDARSDIEWLRLNYSEVVADPTGAFESLGWPIDTAKAASIVNPDHYRHRIAMLGATSSFRE